MPMITVKSSVGRKGKPLPDIHPVPGSKIKPKVGFTGHGQGLVRVDWRDPREGTEIKGPLRRTKRGAINAWNKFMDDLRTIRLDKTVYGSPPQLVSSGSIQLGRRRGQH